MQLQPMPRELSIGVTDVPPVLCVSCFSPDVAGPSKLALPDTRLLSKLRAALFRAHPQSLLHSPAQCGCWMVSKRQTAEQIEFAIRVLRRMQRSHRDLK